MENKLTASSLVTPLGKTKRVETVRLEYSHVQLTSKSSGRDNLAKINETRIWVLGNQKKIVTILLSLLGISINTEKKILEGSATYDDPFSANKAQRVPFYD